jgi:hypothetical protein
VEDGPSGEGPAATGARELIIQNRGQAVHQCSVLDEEVAERVGFEPDTLLETTELSGAIWSSKELKGKERNS